MRNLPAVVGSEVAAPTVFLTELFSIAFPSGTLFGTTADRAITVAGRTYLPTVPVLQGLQGLYEGLDGKPRKVSLLLSGVDQSLISAVLNDAYNLAKLDWQLAICDANFAVLGTYSLASGFLLSQCSIEWDSDTALIRINGESSELLHQRDSAALCSPEQQRLRYAGDAGLDELADISRRVIQWGGVVSSGASNGAGAGGGGSINRQSGELPRLIR